MRSLNIGKREAIILLVSAAIIILSLVVEGICEWVDHDEHIYISSGALIQQGIHPILDYPYAHQPSFSLWYSFVLLFGDHLLLIARICSSLSTALILFLCWLMFRKRVFEQEIIKGESWIMPIIFLLIGFFHNHLSDGVLAWNHAFPTLLLLVSVYFHVNFIDKKKLFLVTIAGFFFAASVAMRASLAPMVIPLFVSMVIIAWKQKRLLSIIPLYIMGCLIGSAAVFGYMAADFDAFIYQMVTFHGEVDTQYLIDTGRARSIGRRLGYVNALYSGHSALFLTILVVAMFALKLIFQKKDFWKFRHGDLLILSIWTFGIVSAFLKNVTFPQYMFLPLPFFLLFAYSIYISLRIEARKWILRASFLALGLMVVKEHGRVKQLGKITKPDQWFAYQVHNEGEFIEENTKPGYVLTMAPTFALEANRNIYLPFVNGPFSYRTADWMSTERRKETRVIGPGEVESFVENKPPTAVYVGWERRGVEEEFIDYALKNKYRKIVTPMGRVLYVRPE